MEKIDRERLLARILRRRLIKGGHWLWTGARAQSGHGHIHVAGRTRHIHRVYYEVFVRHPHSKHVLHKCREAACFNPKHLYLGTPLDNARDKIRDSTNVGFPGEAHPRACLSERAVRIIQRDAARGKSQRVLARQFGVCKSTIGRVLRGETWR